MSLGLLLLGLIVGIPFLAIPFYLLYEAVWSEDAEEWLNQIKD